MEKKELCIWWVPLHSMQQSQQYHHKLRIRSQIDKLLLSIQNERILNDNNNNNITNTVIKAWNIDPRLQQLQRQQQSSINKEKLQTCTIEKYVQDNSIQQNYKILYDDGTSLYQLEWIQMRFHTCIQFYISKDISSIDFCKFVKTIESSDVLGITSILSDIQNNIKILYNNTNYLPPWQYPPYTLVQQDTKDELKYDISQRQLQEGCYPSIQYQSRWQQWDGKNIELEQVMCQEYQRCMGITLITCLCQLQQYISHSISLHEEIEENISSTTTTTGTDTNNAVNKNNDNNKEEDINDKYNKEIPHQQYQQCHESYKYFRKNFSNINNTNIRSNTRYRYIQSVLGIRIGNKISQFMKQIQERIKNFFILTYPIDKNIKQIELSDHISIWQLIEKNEEIVLNNYNKNDRSILQIWNRVIIPSENIQQRQDTQQYPQSQQLFTHGVSQVTPALVGASLQQLISFCAKLCYHFGLGSGLREPTIKNCLYHLHQYTIDINQEEGNEITTNITLARHAARSPISKGWYEYIKDVSLTLWPSYDILASQFPEEAASILQVGIVSTTTEINSKTIETGEKRRKKETSEVINNTAFVPPRKRKFSFVGEIDTKNIKLETTNKESETETEMETETETEIITEKKTDKYVKQATFWDEYENQSLLLRKKNLEGFDMSSIGYRKRQVELIDELQEQAYDVYAECKRTKFSSPLAMQVLHEQVLRYIQHHEKKNEKEITIELPSNKSIESDDIIIDEINTKSSPVSLTCNNRKKLYQRYQLQLQQFRQDPITYLKDIETRTGIILNINEQNDKWEINNNWYTCLLRDPIIPNKNRRFEVLQSHIATCYLRNVIEQAVHNEIKYNDKNDGRFTYSTIDVASLFKAADILSRCREPFI